MESFDTNCHDLTGFSILKFRNIAAKIGTTCLTRWTFPEKIALAADGDELFRGSFDIDFTSLTTISHVWRVILSYFELFFEIFSEFGGKTGDNFNGLTEFLLIRQRQMAGFPTRYFLRYFWFDRTFEMIRTINFSTLSFTSCFWIWIWLLNFDSASPFFRKNTASSKSAQPFHRVQL